MNVITPDRIKIDNTDIFLEDMGNGQGKITISDTYGHNYSMFWGAMGMPLRAFLRQINADYFVNKLLGSASCTEVDVKRTFSAIRKHIREAILPWYKNLDFQADMREKLNSFQNECAECPSEHFFVDNFYSFIKRLDYYLIDDYSYDKEFVEEEFKSISEPWGFIVTKKNRECLWLEALHAKLKKAL